MSTPPPITAADVPPEWIPVRAEIIAREGYATRAGQEGCDAAGAPFTIEVKSLTTNLWHRLTLPGGAIAFQTAADRDVILAQLQGETHG